MAYVEYPMAYVEYPVAYVDYPVAYFDYIFLYIPIYLYIPIMGVMSSRLKNLEDLTPIRQTPTYIKPIQSARRR